MLTLANPFENVPSRSFFPRQGKADGRAGRGRGAGEGDMGVINENSLAPPQIFHPILTLFAQFMVSFIAEKSNY